MMHTPDQSVHTPVMLHEMLALLAPARGGTYLDCTFGAGGYSRAILDSCDCNVVAIDRDPNVKEIANRFSKHYHEKFRFINTTFADSFTELGEHVFQGVVLDLGVSSMQLDEGDRGFSFVRAGPLDMRMSQHGYSAEDFINSADENEIANVIYQYGDEGRSRRIAKKIVENRQVQRIDTTEQLANIVRGAIGYKNGKIDPATKTFQAIRIHVNNELQQLHEFLASVAKILAPKGRLIIISFHSLEDRIVKKFFKEHSIPVVARSKYSKPPNITHDPKQWLKILTSKPLSPSKEEITLNPRARSARLRGAEKMSSPYEN